MFGGSIGVVINDEKSFGVPGLRSGEAARLRSLLKDVVLFPPGPERYRPPLPLPCSNVEDRSWVTGLCLSAPY